MHNYWKSPNSTAAEDLEHLQNEIVECVGIVEKLKERLMLTLDPLGSERKSISTTDTEMSALDDNETEDYRRWKNNPAERR
jgi:hypothetical protein|tara:strand:+ start:854 stop:1096 length:243 start_codon:yes stop_codon:yes gene_type:complete